MASAIPWWRWGGLLLTPLLLSPLLILAYHSSEARCLYVVLVMAVYWSLELLPLPVTSLLPVILFPLLGVMDTNTTAMVYMKGVQMMYMGSLMVALAVEESGLHRRIALTALSMTGTSPGRLMLGFMLPTAFLSMWISNAATSAMMVPILEAVLGELGLGGGGGQATMLYLSLAYAANVGGTATLIGTPPNLILMGFLNSLYPDHPLNFGSWMAFALPQVVVNLCLVWLVLQVYFMGWRSLFRGGGGGQGRGEEQVEEQVEMEDGKVEDGKVEDKEVVKEGKQEDRAEGVIREKLEALGPMTFHERAVLALFLLLVGLWFLRKPGFLGGWADLLQWEGRAGSKVTIGAASPTLAVVLLLFVVPADPRGQPGGPTLLQWGVVQTRFPWGIILLMGGGFALAKGAAASCLTHKVGSVLSSLYVLPPFLILLVLCLTTSAISQIASNSATTSMLAPVVLSMAAPLGLNPIYLALGTTLTASHAFMLPVSTPPNAIVFTAGGFTIRDMAGVGSILNLLCICSTLVCLHTYGQPLLGLHSVPSWANVTLTQDSLC